jgi:acetyl-CoA C-acetyltransferase
MSDVVILSYARTPIGRFQGGLASFKAPALGTIAIQEAMRRADLAGSAVDEVIMGNVLQAGVGQNPARQAARGAGIPDEIGSYTVNKVCGSGLKAVALAAQAIKAGDANLVVAGGFESMTQAPYSIPKARDGLRLGHGQLVDLMVADGLWDVYNNFHMGMTAELVAKKYEITRQAQDAFAAESHRRAAAAQNAGKFSRETAVVEIKDKKGAVTKIAADEGVRADATAEGLAKLKPAFDPQGSVTPGNASQISDGGAAVVVCSAEKAKALGKKPVARITGYATGGMAPEWVMMAPVVAVKKLWEKTGTNAAAFDLYELNEPFCAASLAVGRELGVDAARTNIWGGATALGHPIGASGARILCTLLSALEDTGGKRGVAGLCLGGGNAIAMSVERL